MAKIILGLLVAYATLLCESHANPIDGKAFVATEFLVLHNNDMHARFEQTNVNGGTCAKEDANSNKCYGGFARVAYEVRKHRKEAEEGGLPVVYLNAGDTYTGTPWFAIFKDNISAAFLNILEPDAISLGNHEFDEKVEGLIPFLRNVNFPVLTCNLDLSKEPEMAASQHLMNSTVLEVNGTKIGVIGYLTPDTKYLVTSNTIDFLDEVESINEEAAKLKAQGINIIIALGHSGYQRDQEIAAKCPEVDVVIGGHTHSFLYTGTEPDVERSEGPYPTIVKQSSGKEVPVVQAYAYTKYLGKLHLQFDKDGNLIEFDGTPILLNASVPRENDVLQLLDVYRPNITELENSIVGHTKVQLEGRSTVCRQYECNLGNLIADSMVYARVMEDQGGVFWTDAPIAIINGGGIRSGIDKRSDGSITANDVLSVLPFKNKLYVIQISGTRLRATLELSATKRTKDSSGGFLQFSGLHVTYNYQNEEGNRVTSVEVRCGECEIPDYEPLDDSKTYSIVTSEFLKDGGDQHELVENGTTPVVMKWEDDEALSEYLKHRDFVYPGIEGRITVIDSTNSAASIPKSIIWLIFAFLFIDYSISQYF
ncbi:PREDICTED: protein 5NUC-like [Rhagoletis zephyria]|uniref:protein 5NUC-like n=1 Tax=Rhagoletis zephyria TaxID=28612 RepID=UPI0008115BB9|nr:PREDICTED: protein 5NUC-like [Rhagoletis zephyria]XP_017486163.1 PREDICTED: protein 5NUC-like [Rhagoletis zephyria]XP_017486164.1 PREDICTED: protein 5NUC-like [Rhagoletis zephyria]